MKLLAVLFLVGFALASAVPAPSHDLTLDDDEVEFLIDFAVEADDGPKTDLGKRLKELLDDLRNTLRDVKEKGVRIKEETLNKIHECYRIFKSLGTDAKIKFTEVKQVLTELLKEYFKHFWNILKDKNRSKSDVGVLFADDKTYVAKLLDFLKEFINKFISDGKEINEVTVVAVKEICRLLKDLNIDAESKIREILDDIKDITLELKNRIIKIIFKDFEPETELGQRLKERFDEILEKFREAMEKGKNVSKEYLQKLKDVIEKVKEKQQELGQKGREIYEHVKEKVRDFLQKLLNKNKHKRDIDIVELVHILKDEFSHISIEEVRSFFQELDQNPKFRQELLSKLKEGDIKSLFDLVRQFFEKKNN